DAVDAVRAARVGVGLDLRQEFCALELERLELTVDRAVEIGGSLRALSGQRSGGLAVAPIGPTARGRECGEALGAGIDQSEIGGIAGGKRIEAVDRYIVLARRRPQRKQALLDSLELARIVIGCPQRRVEMPAGVIERAERRVER